MFSKNIMRSRQGKDLDKIAGMIAKSAFSGTPLTAGDTKVITRWITTQGTTKIGNVVIPSGTKLPNYKQEGDSLVPAQGILNSLLTIAREGADKFKTMGGEALHDLVKDNLKTLVAAGIVAGTGTTANYLYDKEKAELRTNATKSEMEYEKLSQRAAEIEAIIGVLNDGLSVLQKDPVANKEVIQNQEDMIKKQWISFGGVQEKMREIKKEIETSVDQTEESNKDENTVTPVHRTEEPNKDENTIKNKYSKEDGMIVKVNDSRSPKPGN